MRAEALTQIEPFSDWLAQWRQTNGSPQQRLIAHGRELAMARRAALKNLIALDPKAALERAVPRTLRAGLPAEVVEQLETPIDAFGRYEVLSSCFGPADRTERWATIGGQQYETYTYGRRLAALSKNRLAIHGIAIDGDLALAELPYRRLEPAELAGQGYPANALIVATGDSTKAFASDEELETWAVQHAAAEALHGPDAYLRDESGETGGVAGPGDLRVAANTATAWTTGNKKVLVIRVDFSDLPGDPQGCSAAYCQSVMDTEVAPFFAQSSFGQTSLTTTVTTQVYRMPKTADTYAANMDNGGLQNDARAGAATDYTLGAFDRIIVFFTNLASRPNSKIPYAGLANLGGSGVWINGEFDFRVVAHELGHTYGLSHAGLWKVTDGNPISTGGSVEDEYGDDFDTMGVLGPRESDFNPQYKNLLGWLADSQVQTVATSGTYRINRFDNSTGTGTLALKIKKDSTKNYWIGIRRNFLTNTFMANGAYVFWGYNDAQSTAGIFQFGYPGGFQSALLDMGTPGAAPSNQASHRVGTDFDAALVPGRTFTDPDAGVQFTVLANGGTAPNEFTDVRVDFGAIGNNHNPVIPTVTSIGDPNARSEISYTATSSDPDGDTVYYCWDFGDGLINPTTATVTHRWLKGGPCTVGVTAFDGKGGRATATINVFINDPLVNSAQRANGLTTEPLYDVIYAGGQFVATGGYATALSPDGATWTLAPMTYAQQSNGVAFGGGLYVEVGQHYASTAYVGSVSYSTDGLTWRLGTLPEGAAVLNKVAYGAGRFVAVGAGGKIYASVDGINWSEATAPTNTDLHAICYAEGVFMAAGDYGCVLTSTDGLAWSNRTQRTAATFFNGVARYNGSWYVSSILDTWISSDAVTWTITPRSFESGLPTNLGTGLGALFAPGDRNGKVYITQDATTWVSILQSGSTTDSFYGVAEGNGTVVVVGSGGLIYQLGTPALLAPKLHDAATMTQVTAGRPLSLAVDATGFASLELLVDGVVVDTSSGSATSLNWVPSGFGLYWLSVRGTTAGGAMFDSTPIPISAALPWTQRASGLTTQSLSDVTYGGGQFVATGGYVTVFSFDGASWIPTPMTYAQINNGVVYGGGRYVEVGQAYVSGAWVGSASYSTNGFTWQLSTFPAGAAVLNKVAYGAGRFVAVGTGGKIYASTDGNSWSEATSGATDTLVSIRFAEGIFVAAGNHGLILTSTDGLAWSNRTPSTSTANFGGVAHSNGLWYVSAGYETWTSSDADTWTETPPSFINGSVNSLCAALGVLFIPSYNGKVYFTQDTATWVSTMPTGSTTGSFFGAAEGNGTIVVVGSGGLIYQAVALPTITLQPASQACAVGSPVTFTSAVGATLAPTFQWQKNGVNISGATSSTYTIAHSLEGDAGAYAVVVSNSTGSVTSNVATLNFIPAGFEVTAYLARYPDVAAVYGSDPYGAWIYYRDHGIYQGEVYDELFRVEEYLALYPELAALFGSDLRGALIHWLSEGSTEGRLGRIPQQFSAAGYFTLNPDVALAVNNDPILAWGHFWLYGIYEGRSYDDQLRVFEYLAINADLTAAFVNDWRSAALHWMRYGQTEGRLGRIPLIFNQTTYLARSPDVAAVWGTNPTTVFLHYWTYGINESRTFDDTFRPAEYLAMYTDLQAIFGTDLRGAFKHWVRYGQSENRLGRHP